MLILSPKPFKKLAGMDRQANKRKKGKKAKKAKKAKKKKGGGYCIYIYKLRYIYRIYK